MHLSAVAIRDALMRSSYAYSALGLSGSHDYTGFQDVRIGAREETKRQTAAMMNCRCTQDSARYRPSVRSTGQHVRPDALPNAYSHMRYRLLLFIRIHT